MLSGSTRVGESSCVAENGDPGYAIGEVIATRYQLQELLGCGGMGMVFRAHDLGTDSAVALKLPLPEANGREDAEYLLAEARIEAALAHPHIVRALDFGHAVGCGAFVAMELLAGESLGQVVAARGRLSARDAVRMLLPIVDAMRYAHARGVLHLDLKPENIFIATRAGRVQPTLLDFGVACSIERDGPLPRPVGGTVTGSPGYMAPEQAEGRDDLDERADIWALCVVLYEAISGRRAFQGDSYASLARAVLQDEVTPFSELSVGDESLWTILECGLAKQRDRRFRTMQQLGRALARWLLVQGIDDDIAGNDLVATWQFRPPATAVEGGLRPELGRPKPRARRNVMYGLGDASQGAQIAGLF